MYNRQSKSGYRQPKVHKNLEGKSKRPSIKPLHVDSKKLANKRVNIQDAFEKYFGQSDFRHIAPIQIRDLVGDNKVSFYSSHGEWSTVEDLRKIEVEERDNFFPSLPSKYNKTPAIWVTLSPRLALRYLEEASEWDRLDSDSPLTKQDKELLKEISSSVLEPEDIVACSDYDGGYLILRPKR